MLQFLSATDNIDECVKLLTRYYDFKNEAPEFCKNRIFESEEIKKCLETINYIFLPVTPDNCSIIYQSFASNKSSDFVYDVAIKTYFMMTGMCELITNYAHQTNYCVHCYRMLFNQPRP